MTLDERLDAYPLLPPDDRAAIDREVASHPSLAGVLAEAQALAARVDAAARAPVTADDVARRETDRLLGHATPDADRIDDAVSADPALRDEAARARARLAGLAASAEAPADQFARLVAAAGFPPPSLDAPVARAERVASDRPATPRAASDRAAAAPPRARRATGLRRLVLVAVVCVVGYGAAVAGSALSQSDRDRMAALGELSYAPPATRGGATPTTAEQDRLAGALAAVGDARRTTLGLFPRYDADALARAADALGDLTAADPASATAQEARFALARVRLQQRRDEDAARLLGAIVQAGGYRAPDARRLLDWLRAQAP